MDLDSLEPALPSGHKVKKKESKFKASSSKSNSPKKKQSEEESVDIMREMGLFTVDDLLGSPVDEHSDDSEIGSVISDVKSEVDLDLPRRSPTPLKSILSTPRTPRTNRGRVRLSLTEVRSRSPSPDPISTGRGSASVVYTDDFDDDYSQTDIPTTIRTDGYDSEESIHTALDSVRSSRRLRRSESEYSDDFTSGGETPVGSRRSSRQLSRSSSRESDDYDTASYSDSYTSYSESRTEVSM